VLIDISVRRLAEEKMKDKWSARFFSYLGNNVLIAQMNSREQSLELTDYCDRFCRLALKVCKATVTAGIGTVTDDIGGLDESYIGAREAVSYRTVYGAGRAINISEADPGTSGREAVSADEDVLADILRSIRTGREIGIESEVRSYVQNFSKGAPSVRQYQFFTFEVLGKLYKFASDNHLRADDIFAGAANNSDVMDTEELIQFMTDKLTVMKQMIEEGRDRGRTGFVGKALQYVEEHYAEEGITIEKVCHELGVSSAYFSTIFKKETGKTFVTCLTDYRMDRAVELLDNEDLKTYVIAQKVGFSDPNYFSYVFKRKFGVSPSRYRSGQKK
jgi:two-component system response regulator YesN